MCTSLRPGVAQHLHDLARRVAAHDRVVHDDDALAGDDLGQRVELQPQAVLAQLLAGLDEGARDVAVLDQPVVLREAGGAREAARRRVAGVRHRDHEIGVDRRLAARISPIRPRETWITWPPRRESGPREVDVLEDAQRAARRRRPPGASARPFVGDRDDLAGLDVAQELGADDVERAGLRRDAVAVAEHARATSGRRPSRIAEGDDAVLGHHDRASRRPRRAA